MTMTSPVDTALPVPTTTAEPVPRRRLARLLRGRPEDPAWVRPGVLALLLATAVLYLWGLGASGWANSYYSAAAQAGSASWKALFFGSFDASNAITVDKTPASLWPMALSVRIFGLNSWSILVPEALAGVASVGLLYATVRRWFSPTAALLAGAVMATTPVAVLMFRFNNPDALLVLLLVAAAYALVRALESGSTRWLALVGVLVGFGFLTKMLQALLVVPGFALVYLIAGPPKLGKRVWQLLLAGLAMVLAAGWYIAIVELLPASARPYIGGSQSNSLWELTLGYNGLGRITGTETGSVGGGMGWGETGWTRMFDAAQGGQVAWLLPAALILLVAGLVITWRAPRTDRVRAGFLLWGGWLLTTGLVFSFMQGIFHAYYTVALAPAIGALVGIGATLLWQRRQHLAVSATLAAVVAVTSIWGYVLLARSSTWLPWLRWTVLVVGIVAAVALLGSSKLPRRFGVLAAAAALVAVLAGPVAYAVDTAATAHGGAIPSAGPAVAGAFGGPGGAGGPRRFNAGTPPQGGPVGQPPAGARAGGPGGTQAGAPAGAPGGPAGRPGGSGGLLEGSKPSSALVKLLQADADSYTWVAATVGANNAAGYQLATGEPVMAIGGFNGSDPSPTLAQFKSYVAAGKIHYFVGGSGMGMQRNGGSGNGEQIAQWVADHYTARTVGGATVYDLTS
jgi:4-amino-4-deoxy-L-arabinose transferase-like glycosyltransferase